PSDPKVEFQWMSVSEQARRPTMPNPEGGRSRALQRIRSLNIVEEDLRILEIQRWNFSGCQ
ncbi:hypothetical protein WA026_011074, partial [Henosepilachna vigintioctopunctata]